MSILEYKLCCMAAMAGFSCLLECQEGCTAVSKGVQKEGRPRFARRQVPGTCDEAKGSLRVCKLPVETARIRRVSGQNDRNGEMLQKLKEM